MNKQISDDIQELGTTHFKRAWESIVDTRILGVLFHLITLGVVKEANLLVTAQSLVMLSPPAIPTSDKLLLREFLNLLRADHSMAIKDKSLSAL